MNTDGDNNKSENGRKF